MKSIKYIQLALLMFVTQISWCQISINYASASVAANSLAGPGITITNATFTGGSNQLGVFSNGFSYMGIANGIVLAPGDVSDIAGSNDGSATQSIGAANPCINGDPDLAMLAGLNNGSIKCPAILEFDFQTTGTQAEFRFVFASEEYLQYSPPNDPGGNPPPVQPCAITNPFNDVMGFFISGNGISGPFSNNAKNIAVVPNTNIPVSVNTINLCYNSSYFVNNCYGTNCDDYNNTILYNFDPSHLAFFFNGYTKVMPAKINVLCTPGEIYHAKLAISNVSDFLYPPAVFIEAGSFTSDFNLGTITASPSVICEGQPTTLTVQGDNGWTYDWSDGQSGVGLKNINVTPPVGNSTYTVTATNTDGCQLTQSINVIVHPNNNTPPYVNGINNTGEYTYFANSGDIISFDIPSFDNPDEEVIMSASISMTDVIFTTDGFHDIGTFTWEPEAGAYGVYNFTVQVCDQNVCGLLCQTYVFTIVITCPQCPLDIYYENRSQATTPLPPLTQAARKIVAGESVDPTQVDGPVIVGPGEYVVFEAGVVDVANPGFSVNGGTFIMQIVPGACISECDDCCVDWTGFTYDFIPNVFTPNGDGVNDVWLVPDYSHPDCAYNANGFELTIYDRWGCAVYVKNENYNYCCPFTSGYISWNGYANTNCIHNTSGQTDSYNGQLVSDGVYYYILKFKVSDASGCYQEFVELGDITIFGGVPELSEQIFENQNSITFVLPDGTSIENGTNAIPSKELETSFLTIYPNPTNQDFTINVSENLISSNSTLEVYNTLGQLIVIEPLVNTPKIINFNQYSAGIYLVKVSGNGITETKLLIKN